MLLYDEVKLILDCLIDEIPEEIFGELNGGVMLLEDEVTHPDSRDGNELYILGQYHYEPRGLGRYVTLHYGSLCRVCQNMSTGQVEEKLREVLRHELVHHLENLAGDSSLEKKDKEDIEKYHARFDKR